MPDEKLNNYELKSIPNYANRVFKACLFDMDGLLIDSEPIYTRITSKILRENFGIPEGISWSVKSKIQGLPGRQATKILIENYELQNKTTPEKFEKLSGNLQSSFWPKVELMPGAFEIIKYLHDIGIPICICTSTKQCKFEMKTNHLSDFFDLFDDKIIMGDNPNLKDHGKPEPDIWILGLDKINESLRNQGENEIKIEECIIFEDALNGALSGKRAGGYVVWVPDENNLNIIGMNKVNEIVGATNEFGIVLRELREFSPTMFGLKK